jgi:hypothetical protein
LREFEEIVISRLSCRGDWEWRGGQPLRLFSGFRPRILPLEKNTSELRTSRITETAWPINRIKLQLMRHLVQQLGKEIAQRTAEIIMKRTELQEQP